MRQPRHPDGRFKCEPYYPRKVASTCGCAHGRVRPCPIGGKLKPHRDRGIRLFKPGRDSRADVEGFRRELAGNASEQAALREGLDYTRARIKELGALRHRSTTRRLHGATAYSRSTGEDSEGGYRELLAEREAMLRHGRHLRNEAAELRARLRKGRR